jgi:hypothetical protein
LFDYRNKKINYTGNYQMGNPIKAERAERIRRFVKRNIDPTAEKNLYMEFSVVWRLVDLSRMRIWHY